MSKKSEPKKKRSGAEKAAHLQKHAFKPGQSGNPNGRPKLPADLVEARNYSREELERAVLRIVWASEEAISTELLDPEKPMIVRIIARMTMNAFVTGDVKTASFLLDRAGFPVKKDDRPSTPALLAQMPLDELLKLAGKAMEVLRGDDPLSGIVNITPEEREDI
jgi:hypothetical protein